METGTILPHCGLCVRKEGERGWKPGRRSRQEPDHMGPAGYDIVFGFYSTWIKKSLEGLGKKET